MGSDTDQPGVWLVGTHHWLSLISALLAARQGQKVFITPSETEVEVPVNVLSTPALESRVIAAADISLKSFGFVRREVSFQWVTPHLRIDISADPRRLAHEFRRELGNEGEEFQFLWSSAKEMHAAPEPVRRWLEQLSKLTLCAEPTLSAALETVRTPHWQLSPEGMNIFVDRSIERICRLQGMVVMMNDIRSVKRSLFGRIKEIELKSKRRYKISTVLFGDRDLVRHLLHVRPRTSLTDVRFTVPAPLVPMGLQERVWYNDAEIERLSTTEWRWISPAGEASELAPSLGDLFPHARSAIAVGPSSELFLLSGLNESHARVS